jgi:hypothetical protein
MKASNYRLNGTSLFVVLVVCLCCFATNVFAAGGTIAIRPGNGYKYVNDGDFITTAFTPSQNITTNYVILDCIVDVNHDSGSETFEVAITSDEAGTNVTSPTTLQTLTHAICICISLT